MEAVKVLLDTNTVIDYLAGRLPNSGKDYIDSVIDSEPKISIITRIEILGFKTSHQQQKLLLDFMDKMMVFDLTPGIADIVINLRKRKKIKIPDASIGSTALNFVLKLITRNISDFRSIPGLGLINPHEI